MTIGLSSNVYNDALALPGLLENASSWANDIVIIHAGPNGKASTDGTMEILEKWGVRTVMSKIDDGFGAVRTQCIRESRTDFVMILDADERFHPLAPALTCDGTEGYPHVQKPNLRVESHGIFDQSHLLRELMGHGKEAIRMCRRHWFDFSWKKPCQNWCSIPDWQMRLVRRFDNIGFDPATKMHEHLINIDTKEEVQFASCWQGNPQGLHIDHYHCFFKPKEPEQRKEDLDIYEALHTGSTADMWSRKGYL